jgi:hypothetical protein
VGLEPNTRAVHSFLMTEADRRRPSRSPCRRMGLIRRLLRELVEWADRLNARGASVGELPAGEGGAPGIQSEA